MALRDPARHLQLDIRGAGRHAEVNRLRRGAGRRLLPDDRGRGDRHHVRPRARRVGARDPAHRLRDALVRVHRAAHQGVPEDGRQRVDAGREGSRVYVGLLRGVPLPHPEQLRSDGRRLRGGEARHRPRGGALRRGHADRPRRRLHHHRRRRRGGAHRDARRGARVLAGRHRRLRRGARRQLGEGHPDIRDGGLQPHPPRADLPRRDAPDGRGLPEELRGGVPGRRDHLGAARVLPDSARGGSTPRAPGRPSWTPS